MGATTLYMLKLLPETFQTFLYLGACVRGLDVMSCVQGLVSACPNLIQDVSLGTTKFSPPESLKSPYYRRLTSRSSGKTTLVMVSKHYIVMLHDYFLTDHSPPQVITVGVRTHTRAR